MKKSAKMPTTRVKAKTSSAVVGREMYGGGSPAQAKKHKMMKKHMRYSGR